MSGEARIHGLIGKARLIGNLPANILVTKAELLRSSAE